MHLHSGGLQEMGYEEAHWVARVFQATLRCEGINLLSVSHGQHPEGTDLEGGRCSLGSISFSVHVTNICYVCAWCRIQIFVFETQDCYLFQPLATVVKPAHYRQFYLVPAQAAPGMEPTSGPRCQCCGPGPSPGCWAHLCLEMYVV